MQSRFKKKKPIDPYNQALAGSRESRDPGNPGIPGFYVKQNPGIFETAIPGFFGIYCHYVLDPLERSYAK